MKMSSAIVLLVLLGSCTAGSPEATPSEQPSPAFKAQSTEPPAWAPPANYRFDLKSSCGERSLIGRFHVIVTNDKARARALDERARAFMRYADEFGGVPSIKGLLDEADAARADGADVVDVVFDPKDGHPTRIDIDYNEQAIDDEACYAISDYREVNSCKAILCISHETVTAGQEVTITFAPPKDQIWGVDAELRPVDKKRVAWLSAFSDDERLRTVWPGPNIGFPDIGFYGSAQWRWTVPARLEPGVYAISKDSIRDGTDPIDDRINEWTVSFEVVD